MTTRESSMALKEIDYYYDNHPTEEDLMGDSEYQHFLMHYLLDVLTYQFLTTERHITGNLNLYYTEDATQYPNTPDITVFGENVVPRESRRKLTSWRINPPDKLPPSVVFEIASAKTWHVDVDPDPTDKPNEYGIIGIKEYYAYDPNTPRLWGKKAPRLRGWWYATDKQPQEQVPNEQGWLWSDELDSWLVPDGEYLRLYDRQGKQRPTLGEAEKARANSEQRRANSEQRRANSEQAAKLAEQREKERFKAELDRIMETLRRNGIDPDKLSSQ